MIEEVKGLMDTAMLLAGILAVAGLYMPKRLHRLASRHGVRRERS